MHENKNKAVASAAFELPMAFYIAFRDAALLGHAALEYAAFVCLPGSLFVISGGIRVGGSPGRTPAANTVGMSRDRRGPPRLPPEPPAAGIGEPPLNKRSVSASRDLLFFEAMLESIQIEGFRGIRTGKLDGLSRINILIGPNGCGKSTILEAINLAAAWWFPSDVLNEGRIQNLSKRRNEQNFTGWSFRHLYQTPVVFTLSLGGVKIRSKVTIGPTGYSPSRDPAGLEDNPPLQEYLRKLLFLDAPRVLSNIVETKLWKEAFLLGAHIDLMALFEKIYGRRMRNLTFTLDGDLLVDTEPVPLRLDDLGGGMRIAFRLLLAAPMTGGSALLLEEFDAYQYKTSLEKLAAALCDIADRRDVQLFLTTHSLESVHAFLTAAASKPDAWIKVFPLSLDAEGELRARGMPRNDALGLMAAGMDLRDLTSYAK